MGNDTCKMFDGAKLALISRGSVLTLLRDDKSDIPFPAMWDFPGGGREQNETPEQCILRELMEEFGLTLSVDDLIYNTCREGVLQGQAPIWFFGAQINEFNPATVQFGNEGQGWQMMPIDEYMAHVHAIRHLQEQLRGFLSFLDGA